MTEPKISKVLEDAWALIDTPEKWTQYAYARDAHQRPVRPLDTRAVCFCSIGALRRVLRLGDHDKSTPEYIECRRAFGDQVMTLNDHAVSHGEIRGIWLDAIKEARKLEEQHAH